MNELIITTSQVEDSLPVTVLHLKGHLHGATENDLIDRTNQLRDGGSTHILLDLSELEVLSSAGLRAIHNIFNLLTPAEDLQIIREHRAEPYKSPYVKLVCPNPDIYYILNITGFLQNLLIYNNMDEAVQSFSA